MNRNKNFWFSAIFLLTWYCSSMAQTSPHGTLTIECTSCHGTSSWTELKVPLDFDHSKTTFSLSGRHSTATCKQCHTTLKFAGTPTDCFTCHRQDFLQMRMPDHQRGQFSHDCTTCHTVNGWRPSIFDHQKTNFQLTGSHIAVDCYSCHQNAQFAGTPTDCYSCHRTDFAGAQNPNHQQSQISHDCTTCHTVNSWTTSTFDHSKTNFPLQGAHQTTDCGSCHVNGRFAGTPTDCYSCHQANFAAAKAPDHLTGQFPHDCTTCHTSVSWTPSTFDHSKTNFQLLGAHRTVDCVSCHSGGKFAGTPSTCYACHQTEFTNAPSHAASQYSHDCLTCHSMDSWPVASFDHAKTSFPLQGAHQSVQCSTCHKSGQFQMLPTDCYSCHVTNFNNVQSPNHQTGQFSHDCITCHTVNAWNPSTFNHSNTAFPLQGAHQSVQCSTCHTNGQFKSLPTDCYSCHVTNFNNVQSPNHQTGQFSHDCISCHTVNIWKPSTFNHSNTTFPLQGAHQSVQCSTCHKNGQFKSLPTDCYSCHQSNYNGVQNPSHVQSMFSHDCTTCHTALVWKPSTFNHSNTTFPLQGAHQSIQCLTCHKDGQFKSLPTDCYSCHVTNFNNVQSPNHQTGQFSHDCVTCHTVNIWKPSTFNHSNTTFPLQGAHQSVQCSTCHKNGQFKSLPTDCYSCHQSNYNGVQNPSHLQGMFSHDCTTCHTALVWKPSTFNHSNTIFPLQGAHQSIRCLTCHKDGQFKSLPTDCFSCHAMDFNNVQSPSHLTGQFSHDCITCHTVNIWKPSTFNHSNTTFPLQGAHQSVQCSTCHKNGQFKSLPTDCYTCHQSNYNGVQYPNHLQGMFSHDCTTCHTVLVWRPSTFNHSNTAFPLQGAHQSLQCSSCHKEGQFHGVRTDCFGCHQNDFNNVADPNHLAGGFDHNCLSCHTNVAWQPATFDHNKTIFPLTGAHIQVACTNCHVNNRFAGTPTDCYSCHVQNFNGVQNPNHLLGLFPHDCTPCHSVVTWNPSTFNHSNTVFPLTGAHQTTDCIFCHKNGQFQGLSSDCFSCHQTDFTNVTDPNHVAGGFDHNCISCHTTVAWQPATFDHSKTIFPLTGAHLQVTCASCHVNNRFAGTPTDCYSCHLQDYSGATNPNHSSAKYPVTCASCHSTSAWQPATFDHTTFFPISAGSTHSPGRWTFCSDCHTNQANPATFECINCHEHSKSETDSNHHGVSGYSYLSTACYKCHPQGR